ncbi:DNA gyrase subunit A [Neolewinella antarctica]|uniref:DNA gyrase subunit A n=1 Tax=Neolewinella antarctica TaxID=442734 RepID=A0ABX0X874_9BACT|nr:DNA gyrase subunit A [Neolewinella antarctica]NJC25213.1 DNA gyrase subunit A [Neolewinella antarctica]
MAEKQRIIPVNIEDQMKSAYIDYSMSVIVSRALPDVRDGLKPVHRRVLFGMNELGLSFRSSHKKSARIVGEVLGKYHPHGDSSVYDTMVRMAQDWSLRYPLVDGQGNFGSMDGDSPAAMRYTEARLEKISDNILGDLDKDTVDFQFNFDDTLKEPSVLPTRIPNLLVNGASGIAVGMATNMMPHNLNEVIDGIFATIDNPEITIPELMQYVKAPDFPTGGIIYGVDGVREAFETGRGRVVVRGLAKIEVDSDDRETIIINEIPYQINKSVLVAKIAELANEGKITGIRDVRDESDRDGLRIVIEIKRDAMASIVLSYLYKYTALQTSYGVNNVCLVKGRPMTLNLKDMIEEFIDFRIEVIQRRTLYELNKALARAHILIGLLIALDYLDEVIALIRASASPEEAREGLINGTFIGNKEQFWTKFRDLVEEAQTTELTVEGDNAMSEAQAKAILEMRLQKLTGLELDKIRAEYAEIREIIDDLRGILESPERQRVIVKEELHDIKTRFGDERRSQISLDTADISITDMIADDDVVVTISKLGYIKRTNVDEYRAQSRGGRGSRGSKTRDKDFVEHMFIASNHNYLLLFTDQGRCFWLRIYEIPEASKQSAGRVIQNIIAMPKEENIRAYISVQDLTDEEFLQGHSIIFATRKGIVKKTSLEAYSRPRTNGINAISINDGDELLEVKLTTGSSHVFLASRKGQAIHFEEEKVRNMGRTATGVRGISLQGDDDAVVGMVTIDHELDADKTILVVSANGIGKRSDWDSYRITNRGGKGVRTMKVTEKTGELIAMKAVTNEDDLMITNRSGIVIRTGLDALRISGRATQGVRLINVEKGDAISDVAIVRHDGEDREEPLNEEE